jgi:hypothetical protein
MRFLTSEGRNWRMRWLLQNLPQTGVLLALLLSPGRLSAQAPQDAQSPAVVKEQPPAAPELADLIPLATALSVRLASLEKTIADTGDRSQVEHQLGEVAARVEQDAREFQALKDSHDARAGRLSELKAQVERAGDTERD